MRPQLWHQVPYQLYHHLRVPTGRGVRWKLQERDGHRLDFLVSDWSIQNLNMTEKYVVVLCQSIKSQEILEILFPCLIQEGLCDRLWAKGVQWVCRDLQHSIGERLQHSRTRGESRTKCQFPLSLYFQNPCLWLVRFLLSDWPIIKANRSTLLRIKSHI